MSPSSARTTPRTRNALAAAAIAAALGGVLPAPAAARAEDPGLFSITPARRTVVARPPVVLAGTRVSNTTATPLRVTVFPVLLRQRLDGAFVFAESPRRLNAARMILGAEPRRFLLRPGEAREVGLHWQRLPRRARAAHVGVVFQSVPVQRGRQVQVISRLLGVNFLRLPGPYVAQGSFTRLGAEQLDARTLRFRPRVRNDGEFVDAPRGARFTISDARGRVVYRKSWDGDVVLPGAQRDFAIDVRKVLAAGDYVARARMSFGRRPGLAVKRRFTLVGPNRLPTPRVAIHSLQARGHIGESAHVTATVRSAGTAPATTPVTLRLDPLSSAGTGTPAAQKVVRVERLEPGDEQAIDVRLGDLERGDYRVSVTYGDRPGSTDTQVVDFEPTPRTSLMRSVEIFAGRHAKLLLALALVLAVAGTAALMKRRERRLVARLVAMLPPPAPAARVDGPAVRPSPEAAEVEPAVEPGSESAVEPEPAVEPVPDPEPLATPEPEAEPEPEPEPLPSIAAGGGAPPPAGLPLAEPVEPAVAPALAEPFSMPAIASPFELPIVGAPEEELLPDDPPRPEPKAGPREAPAPAPAPRGGARAPARVDVNTADVQELTRLRGVGRAAARRIVEHRERHGPFRSIDDLRSVEGFDASRVSRFAPQVEL